MPLLPLRVAPPRLIFGCISIPRSLGSATFEILGFQFSSARWFIRARYFPIGRRRLRRHGILSPCGTDGKSERDDESGSDHFRFHIVSFSLVAKMELSGIPDVRLIEVFAKIERKFFFRASHCVISRQVQIKPFG